MIDLNLICLMYQYVSIKGYEYGHAAIICGVPQGSILGLLLFLLCLNDFNQAIKCSKIHYFSDDTNLIFLSNYQKTERTRHS